MKYFVRKKLGNRGKGTAKGGIITKSSNFFLSVKQKNKYIVIDMSSRVSFLEQKKRKKEHLFPG